ncbi:hypothetical protein GCM10020331_052020 [Ectobacillus funiculus]
MKDYTAYMITDMLRGVVNDSNGTGTTAHILGLDIAGKKREQQILIIRQAVNLDIHLKQPMIVGLSATRHNIRWLFGQGMQKTVLVIICLEILQRSHTLFF